MFVISFLVYFDKKVHKKLKKKIKQAKNFEPWILLNQTRTEKQMRAAALRHMIYFFSLILHDCAEASNTRVDKQRNEPGRWKSRIVAIFLLFLTLLHVLT